MSAPPQVHLVNQHHSKEFQPHLSPAHRVVPISGECDERDFFGQVLKDSDVVICTAQILYNAMINTEEAKHAELSGKEQDEISAASASDLRFHHLLSLLRYHAAHHRRVPPHQQAVCLQPDHGLLCGEKAEWGETAAAGSGPDRFSGYGGSRGSSESCGTRPTGQGFFLDLQQGSSRLLSLNLHLPLRFVPTLTRT